MATDNLAVNPQELAQAFISRANPQAFDESQFQLPSVPQGASAAPQMPTPQAAPMPQVVSPPPVPPNVQNAFMRAMQPGGGAKDIITRILAGKTVIPDQALTPGDFMAAMQKQYVEGVPVGETFNALRAQHIKQAEDLGKLAAVADQQDIERGRMAERYVSNQARYGLDYGKMVAGSIQSFMAPLQEMAKNGQIPLASYAKAYSAVVDNVNAAGAISPIEVANIGARTIAALGLPNPVKIMKAGADLTAVSYDETGKPTATPFYHGSPQISGSPFRGQGPVVDGQGNFLGYSVLDNNTGIVGLMRPGSQKVEPLPADARPRTTGNLDLGVARPAEFTKTVTEMNQTEIAVDQLSRYMKGVQNSDQGWKIAADKFIGQLQTAAGGNPTPEQLAVMTQNGQLQGLLGKMRLEVVGPGVMTEQDAIRVLNSLGGNVDMWRNKDVVGNLIKQAMEYKVRTYNNVLLPTYNSQIQNYPRGTFAPKAPLQIDDKLFGGGDSYKSLDDLKSAVKAGKIGRDDAASIARKNGWIR